MADESLDKYPLVRVYKCPKCKQSIYSKRQGESITYMVYDMDKNEPGDSHSCSYIGPISFLLLKWS